ncbi:MAG: VWA domain-containing protein [Candidatus Paceibacterota bacterium]
MTNKKTTAAQYNWFKKKSTLFVCLSKINVVFLVSIVIISQLGYPLATVAANSNLALNPIAIGNYDYWNGSNKVAAVADNSDSTYIMALNDYKLQSFSVTTLNIPLNSVINSVTLNVRATKASAGDAKIKLLVENGTGVGNRILDGGHSLLDSFSDLSEEMPLNPFNGKTWTISDFNSMRFGIEKSEGLATAVVSKIFVTINYVPGVDPVTNPTLPTNCGLDVALVMDNSSSITSDGLDQEKTAFRGLVSDLSGTPTEFAVVSFGATAQVKQVFTNNISSVNNAIDSLVYTDDVATNWEDALVKAQSVFPNRTNHDLVIFASDGDPTVNNGSNATGDTTDGNDLYNAIASANIIKNSNRRIITLGVGSNVTQANLVAISSADAYDHATDFAALGLLLKNIATDLCGGTINVTKIIDTDGNPLTIDDQTISGTAVTGWNFNVAGQSFTTDSNGDAISVDVKSKSGPFSVVETSGSANYNFATAQCIGASSSNGTLDPITKTISGIAVANNDIVSCTFYNTPKPECVADADCSDGIYCNGVETCVAGSCVPGISVTCAMHDALGTCGNVPDGNLRTWDFRAGYSELCNESTDSCDAVIPPYVHTCDKTRCGAGCVGNSDCPDTVCGTSGCVGKDYYTYTSVSHTCAGCACTTEQCAAPEISYNDPGCGDCLTNGDCAMLNAVTCQGSLRLQSLGVCNNFSCETATSTLPDCNDGQYCNGTESCSGGACVAGTDVSCEANNIFAIGTCDNTPDGNPWTYDFRAKFTSECQESTQSCSVGDAAITHTCDKQCNAAACATNTDCNDNNSATTDVCNTDTCQCSNTTIPTCGDGAKNQTSEQCDNGAANGTPCVPAYGQTCDYCTASCATASVTGAFCGDGTPNGSEQCDDGNSANNDACSNTCTTNNIPGQKSADLAVTKTVDPATVKNGQETIFTIHVVNNGPDSAASTTVTDVLPAGLTFVSATSTVGIYVPSTGLWNIGDMAVNQTETLKITALVSGTEGTSITNHVAVEIDPKIDLNLSNNTADTTVVITTTGGGGGGGNPSTGGDKMPGGVTPQVAGASTEKLDLDDIQRQLDTIKQKINDIAGQIAKLPKGVLGATDVSTGACDNALPEDINDTDLLTILQKLRSELCVPETAKAPTKPAKK